MKKQRCSKILSILLALVLLMQNLAPVHASGDGIPNYCQYCEEARTIEQIEYIQPVEATCQSKGKSEGWKCLVCKNNIVEPESTDPLHHTVQSIAKVPATCTTPGTEAGTKCSVCGEVLSGLGVIPATDHVKAQKSYKAPTCTEPGWTAGWVCENGCGYKEGYEPIQAAGHDKVVTTQAQAATCTTDGCTEGWTCANGCGYTVASETIPAKGHTNETIPGKAATCTETGLTDGKVCSVCGEILTKQEVIKATGHTNETIPGKAATCTETGLTDGVKCSVCLKLLEAPKQTSKTRHQIVIDPAVQATCAQAGKTEGSHCPVCSTVFTPQNDTPKSTVHKFVPAKDTDPNAGPLDNVCSVCGEKQTGLSQGGGAAVVPYEQVDPSSGSNGFTMTTGNDYATEGSAQAMAEEIASGKLQVFKGKDEDGESLLCLVSPESTMTYLSFEAGTSGVGKVSIVSQDNPGGGATTAEPSNGVGQFGFGIGSDENGKSYLYLVEDGKEVSFTITKEEDEDGRNRVILTTENGSKITIESDSLLYRVQSWDEYTELSGSQLEVEKTTRTLTNTNENGGSSEAVVVEIVFGVKDLGGSEQPEETKPENAIQAIEQQEQTIEEVDYGDSSIAAVEEVEQAKNFIDVVDLYHKDANEENWVPEYCENGIHWFVNSVCKFCGEECDNECLKGVSHKYYDDYYHICCKCGGLHRHIMGSVSDGNGGKTGVCSECNSKCHHQKYIYTEENCECKRCDHAEPHNWVDGKCTRCNGTCPHSNVDKKCVCKNCGQVVHNYKMSPAYDTDSVCTRCKARCSHSSFVIDGDYCKCTTCGRIQTHYWKHSKAPIPNCVCKYCGKTEEHDYDPVTGTCKRCMNECDHTCVPNNYSRCQCTKCGHLLNHKWTEGESSCVCALCGYKLNHLFSFTWGGTTHYVAEYGKTSCTRCGAECKHSFSNCRCTICGAMVQHKWRNGVCTECAAACEHTRCNPKSKTECTCFECGMTVKHEWKKLGLFYKCTKCGYLTMKKPK